MSWKSWIQELQAHLQLERGASEHTIAAYTSDVQKLYAFMTDAFPEVGPADVQAKHLTAFVNYLNQLELGAHTQSRILAGIRAFFQLLILEKIIVENPAHALDNPKLQRPLPDVLSYDEIQAMMAGIDLSQPLGHRNRAILETLYSCGLRVSELTGLRISHIYASEQFIRILGKNRKERLVPIHAKALQHIELYRQHERTHLKSIVKGAEDILFLSRRGNPLSRVMVFYIVKQAAKQADIAKTVSPHTFRHSFATHLVEGGADLKAVQDMLGHASITTTEIYTHLDTDYLRSTIMQYHPRNA